MQFYYFVHLIIFKKKIDESKVLIDYLIKMSQINQKNLKVKLKFLYFKVNFLIMFYRYQLKVI